MVKQFKYGIVFDGSGLEGISPGWEFLEMPLGYMYSPMESNYIWEKKKSKLLSKDLPVIASSHFLQDFGLVATGPGVDREQLEFYTKRAFKRLSQVGVKAAGCYGGHFPVPADFSKTKAMDQAIWFINMMADEAEKYNIPIALEPMANLDTLFPRYLEGIELARESGREIVRVMADLNYFIALDQPLEHIARYPEYCMHCHIQGDGGAQPNVGNREEIFIKLFSIFRDMGYDRGVSAACPWISTKGGDEIDYKYETAETLRYLQELRDRVYGS